MGDPVVRDAEQLAAVPQSARATLASLVDRGAVEARRARWVLLDHLRHRGDDSRVPAPDAR